MMDKLIMRIIAHVIMIGRSWAIVLLLINSGCRLFEMDTDPDYDYFIKCKNDTKDTLLLSTYNGGFISVFDIQNNIIYPDSSTFFSTVGLMKKENPIPNVFSEWSGLDSCWIYRLENDLIYKAQEHNFNSDLFYPPSSSLLCVWDAPFRFMGDSINHFFNYDSWESWLIKETNDGIVQFTIYESDFD